MELSNLIVIRLEILHEDWLEKIIKMKSCKIDKKIEQYIHLLSREFYDLIFSLCNHLPFYSESAYNILEENMLLHRILLPHPILKKHGLTYDHIYKPQVIIKKKLKKILTEKNYTPLSKAEFRSMFEEMTKTICVTKDENYKLSKEKLIYDINLFVLNKHGERYEVDLINYEEDSDILNQKYVKQKSTSLPI